MEQEKIYEFSGFRLDVGERQLTRGGERVSVPEKPFDVLCLLISRRGRLVAKDELISHVWGSTVVEENNLDKSISRLRQLLGERKGSRTFIETVRGHGYRFVADFDGRRAAARSSSASSPSAVRSIAVLPFKNLSTDPEYDFFCEGLAEELLNTLSKSANLRVSARTSAFSFQGKSVRTGEIGAVLGVETLLEGSVRKTGDRIRILVRLVNAADGYTVWSESFDREVKDIFDVLEQIALSIVKVLDVQLVGREREQFLKRYTDDTDAYIEYMKGQFYRWKTSKEDFAKAIKHFRKSVDIDPSFALGYFGISTFYGYGTAWALLPTEPEAGWEMAETAARRALELDDSLPELRLSFAAFDLVHYRKWTESGAVIAAVAAAHPQFPEIHHVYSFHHLTSGRLDEAVDEGRAALKLDPLSMFFSRFVGMLLYHARRYDEAITQLLETVELDPNNPSIHELLGEVYLKNGMPAEALDSWLRVARLSWDDEATTFIESVPRDDVGSKAAVKWIAAKNLERLNVRARTDDYVPSVDFARAHVALGDVENAFASLGQALKERNVFPLMLRTDPYYDPLRGDARFDRLVKAVGNPGY